MLLSWVNLVLVAHERPSETSGRQMFAQYQSENSISPLNLLLLQEEHRLEPHPENYDMIYTHSLVVYLLNHCFSSSLQSESLVFVQCANRVHEHPICCSCADVSTF